MSLPAFERLPMAARHQFLSPFGIRSSPSHMARKRNAEGVRRVRSAAPRANTLVFDVRTQREALSLREAKIENRYWQLPWSVHSDARAVRARNACDALSCAR